MAGDFSINDSEQNMSDHFTASFRPFPALNPGTFAAGIITFSPVAGFRPSRAGRFLTSKVPKPRREAFSPAFKASTMEDNVASRAAPACLLVSSAWVAIDLIS